MVLGVPDAPPRSDTRRRVEPLRKGRDHRWGAGWVRRSRVIASDGRSLCRVIRGSGGVHPDPRDPPD